MVSSALNFFAINNELLVFPSQEIFSVLDTSTFGPYRRLLLKIVSCDSLARSYSYVVPSGGLLLAATTVLNFPMSSFFIASSPVALVGLPYLELLISECLVIAGFYWTLFWLVSELLSRFAGHISQFEYPWRSNLFTKVIYHEKLLHPAKLLFHRHLAKET